MRHATVLITFSLFAPLAVAQSHVFTLNGDAALDNFGYSVSGAGDVDGDGYADFIVGALNDDNNGSGSGMARVFSGRTGNALYTFDGDSAGDQLGYSVAGAGDVNDDGFADLIVGAIMDDNSGSDSGSARVYSGVNGAALYTFNGESAGAWFGFSVAAAGDVNWDGYDDLIVGAPKDYNNGGRTGSAQLFSGLNGDLLFTRYGDSAGDWFGWSVAGAGDVNGKGHVAWIVGAPRDDNNGMSSGSVRVFFGVFGVTIYTFNGDAAGDSLGMSVAGAGDVNCDGKADFIVGAPFDDNTALDSGSARLYSGADGTVLYTLDGDAVDDSFGWSVDGVGDVDGDGCADLIVGALLNDNRGIDSGSARVFSGKDGTVLFTQHGRSAGDQFGTSVAGAGDVNGDGVADLIVGATRDDNNGSNSGSARVFSGATLPLTTDTHVMSVSVASTQNLKLDGGPGNAFKNYWIFTNFAASGNSPGVAVAPGVVIPLNPDLLTDFVIGLTQLGGGAPTFVDWKGTLNAYCKAHASLNTLGPVPVLVGESLTHAALVYTANGCGLGCDTFHLASNWVPMTTVP